MPRGEGANHPRHGAGGVGRVGHRLLSLLCCFPEKFAQAQQGCSPRAPAEMGLLSPREAPARCSKGGRGLARFLDTGQSSRHRYTAGMSCSSLLFNGTRWRPCLSGSGALWRVPPRQAEPSCGVWLARPAHSHAFTHRDQKFIKNESLQRGLGPNGAGRPRPRAPHAADSCRHPVKPSYVPVTLCFSSSEPRQL